MSNTVVWNSNLEIMSMISSQWASEHHFTRWCPSRSHQQYHNKVSIGNTGTEELSDGGTMAVHFSAHIFLCSLLECKRLQWKQVWYLSRGAAYSVSMPSVFSWPWVATTATTANWSAILQWTRIPSSKMTTDDRPVCCDHITLQSHCTLCCLQQVSLQTPLEEHLPTRKQSCCYNVVCHSPVNLSHYWHIRCAEYITYCSYVHYLQKSSLC
jgi:hypothetical protein